MPIIPTRREWFFMPTSVQHTESMTFAIISKCFWIRLLGLSLGENSLWRIQRAKYSAHPQQWVFLNSWERYNLLFLYHWSLVLFLVWYSVQQEQQKRTWAERYYLQWYWYFYSSERLSSKSPLTCFRSSGVGR